MYTQYSSDIVRIPKELEFLTDFITTAVYTSNIVVGKTTQISKTTTTAGVTTSSIVSVHRFVLSNKDGYLSAAGHKENAVDLASAFVEYQTPPTITVISPSQIKVNDITYNYTADAVTSVENTKPRRFMVNMFADAELKGMTVQQIMDFFGTDFQITSLSIPGTTEGTATAQYPIDKVDKSTLLSPKCLIFGYVSIERVLRDCIASNMYNAKGQLLVGPYPFLKKDSTVEDLPPFQYTRTYKKAAAGQLSSLFPYIKVENNKLINNTFVNKKLYKEATYPMNNPAEFPFTPTWIVILHNQPETPYAVTIMGTKVTMGDANGWLHVTSFDEMNIVELTDPNQDGYIDQASNTIFINPNKKCVFRVVYSQAKLGNVFDKTYGYEGCLNYKTGVWSKYLERV